MKKYYVEMDAFESGLREIEHEDGDYYKVEEVDARIADLERTLNEIRTRLHTEGRRPEECYEMYLIDSVL